MCLVSAFVKQCFNNNILFIVRRVSGLQNGIAEALTCFQEDFWKLALQTKVDPEPMPPKLWSLSFWILVRLIERMLIPIKYVMQFSIRCKKSGKEMCHPATDSPVGVPLPQDTRVLPHPLPPPPSSLCLQLRERILPQNLPYSREPLWPYHTFPFYLSPLPRLISPHKLPPPIWGLKKSLMF